jgi:hypothetical protein
MLQNVKMENKNQLQIEAGTGTHDLGMTNYPV